MTLFIEKPILSLINTQIDFTDSACIFPFINSVNYVDNFISIQMSQAENLNN